MIKLLGGVTMRIGIIISFIFIILSVSIVSASQFTEGGFETVNNWVYNESKTIYAGSQYDFGWNTEGVYSYRLLRWMPETFIIGDNASIKQENITFDNISLLRFDYYFNGHWSNGETLEIWIDNDKVWNKTNLIDGVDYYGYNTSFNIAYSGEHTLLFKLNVTNITSSPLGSSSWLIDRIILNNISSVPIISVPLNNSRHYNNSINYTWNTSTDVDGDTLLYDFWLSNQSSFGYTINRTNVTQSPIISQETSDVNNVNQFGQTFTTDLAQTNISNITVWVDNSGYTETWYNLSVWDSSSKTTYIGSKNISFTTTAYKWVGFTFDTPLTVSPLTQYYFEINKGGDGSYGHSYTSWDSYSGGDYYRNGIMVFESDIKFKIYDSKIRISNIATTDGITYYGKVRSYDGYEYSNWSQTVQFTENTKPIYTNVTLSPSTPTNSENLTVSFSVSDIESDSITNCTRWYKDSVLQITLNDSLIVLAFGNTTNGEKWRVDVFGNDGYENSTPIPSNEVIIGSSNAPPTFTSLSISPSTGQIGTVITINASGITDDSQVWRAQTYYLINGGSKVYLGNSSWSSLSYIEYTVNSPWSDSGTYVIYTNIYDSGNLTGYENLTSSPLSQYFVSQLTTSVSTGGGGGGAIIITPTPTLPPYKPSIDITSLTKDPLGIILLELLVLVGFFVFISGLLEHGKTSSLVMGFIIISVSVYGLGWLS